jgi:hypothetical protein
MSILIKTPFRKRFDKTYDTATREMKYDAIGRLYLRIGPMRVNPAGVGKLRLFGLTWAAWAYDMRG